MSLAPPPTAPPPTGTVPRHGRRPARRVVAPPSRGAAAPLPLCLALDLLIVAVAFGLRVWSLGAHSLWLDEALAVLRSTDGLWTAVLGRTAVDLAPPLYPVLLYAWAQPGGPDFWLRFLSAACSVLAVAVILKLPDRRVARAAAAIMAVAPAQLMYAQETTAYSLVALVSTGLLVAADDAARDSRRAWLAFAALAVVGVYSYYGLLFLIVGLDAWLLARLAWQGWRGRMVAVAAREVLGGHALVIAACLPLLPLAAQRSAIVVETWWGRYGTLEGWTSAQLFVQGAVGHGLVFPYFAFATLPAWLVLTLVGLLAWGAVQRPGWFVGGWLIPLALAYLASAAGRYPFEHRYLLIVAPTVYALCGAAFAAVATMGRGHGHRVAQVVSVGTVAAFIVLLLSAAPAAGLAVPWASASPREELRPLIMALAAQRGPADGVYVTYGAGPAAHVYQAQGLLARDVVVEVDWLAGRIDDQTSRALVAARGRGRLWVLVSHARPDEEEALAAALTRRGAWLRERLTAPGAALLRFDPPP